MDTVPVIDLARWFEGTESGQKAVAREVDAALQSTGFFLITNHRMPAELAARTRETARSFLHSPPALKKKYETHIGGRGWIPIGVEANAYAEGSESPPDLKETYTVGCEGLSGNPEFDGMLFRPNVWPDEYPEFRTAMTDYIAGVRRLADELLTICAVALEQPRDFFVRHTKQPLYLMNINYYPAMNVTGTPKPGQFRIGPHCDFGTLVVLDRQPGVGGLQVFTRDGRWVDAPYVPGALTINIGDLLAHWSGDRWRSARHRVLPPHESVPEEELMSLVYFYDVNPDTRIESIPPPIGRTAHEPVRVFDHLMGKLRAINVGPGGPPPHPPPH